MRKMVYMGIVNLVGVHMRMRGVHHSEKDRMHQKDLGVVQIANRCYPLRENISLLIQWEKMDYRHSVKTVVLNNRENIGENILIG